MAFYRAIRWAHPFRPLALLCLLVVPGLALAQTAAPAWELAVSGNNNQPGLGGTSLARASAVDVAGNVFVTGSFTGSVTFGTTQLVSLGASDLFVAKWDITAQTFTWAASGGGSGQDIGLGIAVQGAAIYVTGQFQSGTGASIAGQPLAGAGASDVFVAKYVDTSTGSTPTTSNYANGWAVSGGGTGSDAGQGLAVSSAGVYVTGYFASGGGASVAGQALAGAGGADMFVAKYVDAGTGGVANGWAVSGGGTGTDYGQGLAISGTGVFVTGYFASNSGTSIAGQLLVGSGTTVNDEVFVAKYVDTSTGNTPATSSYASAWAVSSGGTGSDQGRGIAVSGTGVYVTGFFSGYSNVTIAGKALLGSSTAYDLFVAKFLDLNSGSVGNGWAVSGGGPSPDYGQAVAVSGTDVYVTGTFTSASNAIIAGQTLLGAGGLDVFVAKYLDTSTGSTPATSSYANGWVASGGSTGLDAANGLALSATGVYVSGQVGADVGSFRATPSPLYAPANSALLGRLAPATGAWQRIDGPLQGGTSFTSAAAADNQGNVFVTGNFTGAVGFGGTRLVSAGSQDAFVAKWDVTARAFTWAASGGGTGADLGRGIAVSGAGVFVTGSFTSASSVNLAGQALPGAGGVDIFVAKYVDTSTGSTPATSSYANGWVVSGGSGGDDVGNAIAVSGAGVYVTGYYASGNSTTIAGQVLSGGGITDVFVAKYLDTSTGNTSATSSYANGWAVSGGGTGFDSGNAIAVSGTGVFITGSFESNSSVTIAGQVLAGVNSQDIFVAKYVDTSTGSTPATSSYANGWAVSGGGGGSDYGQGIAVSGPGVFVTGFFTSGTGASIAGRPLAGVGGPDVFVAKYVDTSTGSTPATSSVANGWATSAGGTSDDFGLGLVVRGTGVFITGNFTTGASASFAGQALPGSGFYTNDVFVAKYVDTSTGNTPATSSFANGWATSGGGTGFDYGNGLAVSGQQLYAVGYVTPPANFGNFTLSANSGQLNFLSRLTDPTLQALPVRHADPNSAFSLYPNPTSGMATLTGLAPKAAVQVLDALGRVAATTTADATGTATLPGLTPGLYLVRANGSAVRLVVE